MKITSRMIFTASRVFPSFRAHIASRRLMYTRMFVSRPAFYNHNNVRFTSVFAVGESSAYKKLTKCHHSVNFQNRNNLKANSVSNL